jgi:protein-S-isoprenylcysteine O-methyltransferase Ste14
MMSALKSFFWDFFLGRLLPTLFFAAAALAKAFDADYAQQFADRSFADGFRFVGELASFFFFAGLTFTYMTRASRRSGTRKPIVVVSVFVTLAMTSAAFTLRRESHPSLVLAGSILVTIGTIYELYALYHLRKSFAILPEARALVTSGPYGWSRNPLYVAELVAMLGLLLPCGEIALLVVPVAVGQWLRMRWEEQVLAAEFPDEFREYAARVPRWLPLVR